MLCPYIPLVGEAKPKPQQRGRLARATHCVARYIEKWSLRC
jgi:hypothetical protein